MGYRPTIRSDQIKHLFRKQKGRCYMCGGGMTLEKGRRNSATLEHVIPRSRAGELAPLGMPENNVRAACHACNQAKGSMSLEEFLACAPHWRDHLRRHFARYAKLADEHA